MTRRFLVTFFVLFAPALFGQLVRSGSGATAADIIPIRDQFRADLGGGTVAGPAGSFGGVRREINWDGVPDGFSAPNMLPLNFFNVNSPRGAVFTTPGSGVQVSATAASGVPVRFGNIDPTYTATFQAFSLERLFTPIGSNITDVLFFVPGTSTPAVVSGFGSVFTDADTAATTIQYFNASGQSLGTFNVPPSPSGGLSFLGVSGFGVGIGRVRITTGAAALATGIADSPTNDLVVMDDFIYGEPAAATAAVADVAIDKQGPANATATVAYAYTLVVTNNGPDAATNVVVTDTMPAGLSATSATSTQGTCSGTTTVTCSIGTLANGASATITINTAAPAPGDFSNTATVTATSTDLVQNNNSDTVRTVAAALPPTPIPTAGTWALLLLAMGLVAGAVFRMR